MWIVKSMLKLVPNIGVIELGYGEIVVLLKIVLVWSPKEWLSQVGVT